MRPFVLVFLVLGCVTKPFPGQPDGGAVDAGAPIIDAVSIAQLCADTTDAYLARLVRCGEVTSALAEIYRPQFIAECPTSIPPGVAAGRIVIEKAAVTQCLAAVRGSSCLAESPSCALLHGTMRLTERCFEDAECEEALSCDTSSSCPGTCVARVEVGQSPSSGQSCVKSAFLHQGVCTSLVATGQSCAPTAGQAEPLSCAEPNTCTAKVCAPPPVSAGLGEACAGAPCGHGLQCVNASCVALGIEGGACDALNRCQQGLRCANQRCVVVRSGGAGAACADDGDTCLPGFYCDGARGTCAALRGPEGACTNAGNECRPDLLCTADFNAPAGLCKTPGNLGAHCTASRQCEQALFCESSSSTCVARKAAGSSCVESEECLGFCQGLRCTAPPCRAP